MCLLGFFRKPQRINSVLTVYNVYNLLFIDYWFDLNCHIALTLAVYILRSPWPDLSCLHSKVTWPYLRLFILKGHTVYICKHIEGSLCLLAKLFMSINKVFVFFIYLLWTEGSGHLLFTSCKQPMLALVNNTQLFINSTLSSTGQQHLVVYSFNIVIHWYTTISCLLISTSSSIG